MDLQKKKIFRIFELLTSKDLLNLEKFIRSPYHVKPNQQNIYLVLLKTVIKNIRKLDMPVEEKEIFKKLYPGSKFVSGKVDKKLSQFIEITLDFLGWENVKKSSTLKVEALKSLRKRGATNIYLKEQHKLAKRFKNEKYSLEDAQLLAFEMDLEEFRFLNADPFRISQASHNAVYDSLDELYIHYFLEMGIRNLAYNRFIVPLELQSRFDILIQLLQRKDNIDKTPSQKFRERIFDILRNTHAVGTAQIEELAMELENIKNEIVSKAYKNYRTILRSFAVVRYNSGDHSLGAFLFEMYKSEVENRTIFFEGQIPSAVVNNITVFALRQEQMEWLANFLQSVKGKILEAQLDDFTIALNTAKLLFAQGDFEGAIRVLSFDVKEIHLKVYARILELMAYYEMADDQLSYKIEAYKLFIYRLPKNKVSQDFIAGHNSFIKILKSISHPSTAHDLNRIQKLKSKIQKTKILAEKPWLLEKVNVLEEKNN